ncbi:hypothetical protein LOD99_5119 [Oopsacas minuta]|uniref:Uncharacterized protein n=1 Tax=Oopsacas minuta TaxID=111878 RepID=A0AAV7JS44_9METZ|nr:hypothetical protein LOD99_5119 [Oopsacas minuta]
MVTQFPDTTGVSYVDHIEIEINQSIDKLIFRLNQRRVHLLAKLRDMREEMRADLVSRQEMEEKLVDAREPVGMVAKMEDSLTELHINSPPQELRLICDTNEIENAILSLGEIDKQEILPILHLPVIPNYAGFRKQVAFGKEGSGPGDLNRPRGVAIDPVSGHIYVADILNSRIQIFSQTGDHLNIFGSGDLEQPWGILIHQDNIYVTDIQHHAIFQFNLPGLLMRKRFGERGGDNESFMHPRQLTISPNQQLCVADQYNNRLVYLATNLDYISLLRHETMKEPVDVKFTNKEVFVLCKLMFVTHPCIHVFTYTGEKTRSLITRGSDIGTLFERAFFFCLDECNNIVINDYQIKVFSPEGDLLHTIGQHRVANGIAILNNSKLVCASQDSHFGIQIYST